MKIFMKKFITVFICLIFSLCFFVGCTYSQAKEKTAYKLYLNMQKAVADVKSIDMDMFLSIEFTSIGEQKNEGFSGLTSESQTAYKSNGNLKKVKNSPGEFDIAMDFKRKDTYSTSGMNGHTNDVALLSYYTGGIYYECSQVLGQWGPETKKTMTVEDVMNEMNNWVKLDEIVILDFPEIAIKEYKVIDLSDGNKQIEFILSGEFMTGQILEKMRSAYNSPELIDAVLTFNDFTCETVIDKNNMMKSYKMLCDVTVTGFTATDFKEEGHYIKEISMAANSYNDVVIDFPSGLDNYTDIN
ncbi:MAG: hypothetical protein FWF92_02955 [Oscillospiraceae bacterium]|nr:hypothetical protein [Oscillospiraceae bacterium]